MSSPAKFPGVRDADISFWMSVYRDLDEAIVTLTQLRRHYPAARIMVRSDGDDDPRLDALAEALRLEVRRGRRLFTVENGARLVHTMLEMYLEDPAPYLFKIDPDTDFHRRFQRLPEAGGHFGTVMRVDGSPAVQGGCMGFSRDAAEAIASSELLLAPAFAEPAAANGGVYWTYLEFRAKKFGLSSFDWSLGWAAQELSVPIFEYSEVRSVSYRRRHLLPSDPGAVFAVTHPRVGLSARYPDAPAGMGLRLDGVVEL